MTLTHFRTCGRKRGRVPACLPRRAPLRPLFLLFALAAGGAAALTPVVTWDCDSANPRSKYVSVARGETLILRPTVLQDGEAVSMGGVTNITFGLLPEGTTNWLSGGTGTVVNSAGGIIQSEFSDTSQAWTNATFRFLVTSSSQSHVRAYGTIALYGASLDYSPPLQPLPSGFAVALGASGTVWRAEWTALTTNEAALRLAGDVAGSNNVTAAVAAEAVLRLAGDVAGSNNVADTYLPLSWTNGPVGIDAGNTKTNTYGGMVVQLGPRVQQGTGVASGDYSFAGHGSTASGYGSWAMLDSIASSFGSWAMLSSTASGNGSWANYLSLASSDGSWANYYSTASGLGSWANYYSTASGPGSWAM